MHLKFWILLPNLSLKRLHQIILQQQSMTVPVSSHPYPNLIPSTFSIFASLRVFGFLFNSIFLISVFLFHELFVHILCLFFYSIVFCNWFKHFFGYILCTESLLLCVTNNFSQSGACPFTSLRSFSCEDVLILIYFNVSIFKVV